MRSPGVTACRNRIVRAEMDTSAYMKEAEVEAGHWWFTGRRKLFSEQILALYPRPETLRCLDIGPSSGTNLRMLRDIGAGELSGIDMSPEAVAICREKGFDRVTEGRVEEMPFADGSFDLVLATDILEHVDEEARTLQEIRRVLAQKGTLLLAVPAFECLWGHQDIIAHHKRRYRLPQVSTLLESAGFRVTKIFYFNFLLFAPILCFRKFALFLKLPVRNENVINTPLMNRIFSKIFLWDITVSPVIHPPFGVSILALATPNGSGKR